MVTAVMVKEATVVEGWGAEERVAVEKGVVALVVVESAAAAQVAVGSAPVAGVEADAAVADLAAEEVEAAVEVAVAMA